MTKAGIFPDNEAFPKSPSLLIDDILQLAGRTMQRVREENHSNAPGIPTRNEEKCEDRTGQFKSERQNAHEI